MKKLLVHWINTIEELANLLLLWNASLCLEFWKAVFVPPIAIFNLIISLNCMPFSLDTFIIFFFSPTLVAKNLEISDEQRQHILSSQDFSMFFDKATRLVEKAICENMDICFDYGESGEDAEGYCLFLITLSYPPIQYCYRIFTYFCAVLFEELYDSLDVYHTNHSSSFAVLRKFLKWITRSFFPFLIFPSH